MLTYNSNPGSLYEHNINWIGFLDVNDNIYINNKKSSVITSSEIRIYEFQIYFPSIS